MAVAERTSIFGKGLDTLRDTASKIKRTGGGVINQIKPFGSGAKPKIGPQGTGYQPRGPFGGGGKIQGTWGAGIESGNRRAQQIWGQKYREQANQRMQDYAEAIARKQWEQRRLNDMTWQPWKDPRRPLSGGLGPTSPKLTPIQGANQAAKEGAKQVGGKIIGAGGAKILGKGIAAVPILGEAIIIWETSQEAVRLIDAVSDRILEELWEEMGLIPELGENGETTGTPDDFPEEPPPAPLPPEILPVPAPYGDSFTEEAEITVNDSRGGWFKIRIESFYSSTRTDYDPRDPSEPPVNFSYSLPKQTGWAWVRGPRQKFVDRRKTFARYTQPDGWALWDIAYIGGTGYRRINPNRPNDHPLFQDADPRYRPMLLGSEPQEITLTSLQGTFVGDYSYDEYTFGDRTAFDSGVFFGIKWFNEDGTPEDGGELPSPIPKRKRREDEEVADCPNIKPLLIQQNAIIEAKLNQQITEVNEIVAGMQLEINAGNQVIVEAVNDASANIAVDMTDVKNRLGPQIPDGISTKVSKHYDEFRSFLGEAWDKTKGTFDDLMTKFNEYLETFKKFLKWMQIDRILNILTLIATIHNAYMLSANLGQTLISALNTIFTVGGNALGLRDVEDAPIDVSEAISDTFENIAKSVLGAENLEGMRAEWKKYSRIYQAASHVLWAIQSINNSVLGALEIVGSNVAKIGNAIKKWGDVAESAFGWMNPTPFFQNKFFTTLESLEDAGGTVEIVALETLSAQEEISQFNQVKEEFDKAMAQAADGKQTTGSPEAQQVKTAEETAKTGSASNI